jgi:hypothetical protein
MKLNHTGNTSNINVREFGFLQTLLAASRECRGYNSIKAWLIILR